MNQEFLALNSKQAAVRRIHNTGIESCRVISGTFKTQGKSEFMGDGKVG